MLMLILIVMLTLILILMSAIIPIPKLMLIQMPTHPQIFYNTQQYTFFRIGLDLL